MKQTKLLMGVCLVGIAALFNACNSDEPTVEKPVQEEPTEEPIVSPTGPYETLTVEPAEIKNRLNDFSFRLMGSIADNRENLFDKKDANFTVSPISAAFNLAMVANSVEKEVSERITNELGVGSLSVLNLTCREYANELTSDHNGSQFMLTNAVWHHNAYNLQAGYASLMQNVFNAPVQATDFKSPAAVDMINAWCSEYTKGMIPQIINELDPNSAAMLANAIYFNGLWMNPFDVAKNTEAVFKGSSKNSIVEMMHSKELHLYFSDSWATTIVLPFGSSDVFEMVVISPNNIENPFGQLNAARWENIYNGLKLYEVDLSIPKFEVSTDIKLQKPLEDLGINLSGKLTPMLNFNGDANFNISQKSEVILYEEGVIASSVTFTEIYTKGSTLGHPKAKLTLDRPFIYLLHHVPTGAIVMAGSVNNL